MQTRHTPTPSTPPEQPAADARDELVYRKINQLSAVQLAVGIILGLLLVIVTILVTGRLRNVNERIARLEARVNNLADRPMPTDAAPSPPLRPATTAPGVDLPPAGSAESSAILLTRTVAALSARIADGSTTRDARWRSDVLHLLEELETEYARSPTDDLPTARTALRAALLLRDFDLAQRWCSRVLAVDPADAGTAAEVARLGLAVGQYAKALPLARIATQGDKIDPPAIMVRASIEGALGAVEQRDRSLGRALEFEQTAPEAVALLSAGLLARGDYARLKQVLEKAERVVPESAVVRRESLALALVTGDLDRGVGLIEGLDSEDERSAGLQQELGQTLLRQGRYRQALQVYQRITRQRPTEARSFDALGVALLALMRTTEAEAAFAEAISLDRTNARAWYHLGVARANLDNLSGAVEALDASLSWDRQRAEAHFARAVCLARMGDHEAAEQSLQQALALDAGLMEKATEVAAFQLILGGQGAEPATRPPRK